jgi:alginate O-acetyltransferase complex protein AlgI
MSLGAWMRNYLYIPLGGNRVASKSRLYFNLWLVFLASGLWHGASWSFVIWGAYHGLFLILERVFLEKVYNKAGKFISTAFTFLVVIIGWVFFRIEHLPDAFQYLERMFSFQSGTTISYFRGVWFHFGLAFVFAFFVYTKWGQKIQDTVYFNDYTTRRHVALSVVSAVLLTLCVSSITAFGFNPFIYFRF